MADIRVGIVVFIRRGGDVDVLEQLDTDTYKVRYKGNLYELKWYQKGTFSDAFYENIERNVVLSENASLSQKSYLYEQSTYDVIFSSFLWPRYITEKNNGSFGYLRDFVPDCYEEFTDNFVNYMSLRVLTNAAVDLVQTFSELHSLKLCFADIDLCNLYIDPSNGHILISDNGFVSLYGENLGVNDKYPDLNTDRDSLSVLLYRLLSKHNSQGSNLDIYPQYIRDMFRKGSNCETITEEDWINALFRLKGQIGTCPDCRKEMIYNISEADVCFNCHVKIPKIGKVVFQSSELPIANGVRIYLWHIDPTLYDYEIVIGDISVNSDDRSLVGIRNLSSLAWKVYLPDGSLHYTLPDRYVMARNGITIDFIKMEKTAAKVELSK